ncbi:MFS general substrate transporter [Mytilinidion resinicola]|uniref:MFS general substrate transporter n=1 Tax=Mytilinidion resinicola TaxID=574789 RepID=A0A6A6Z2M5_9PEZI|nr:MFS general substrate transporter [Mytilinidion resinicola]KAF2815371.1 MFS general substrate transporter [Mytilinidion resinicola]
MAIEDRQKCPNEEWHGWLQVLVSHLCVFNSFGFINAFGIFQQYYSTTLNLPPSTISWIGSSQVFLVYFIGTFSGRTLDLGHYRLTLFAGLSLQIIGIFTSSVSTQYWQLLLSQGICKGLGDGLIFCPAVANAATHFAGNRWRVMAISSVACGGATGGMVFPAIALTLLHRIGFPWTVRIMGFVMLFNAVVIVSLAASKPGKRKRGPLVEWKAFAEPPYLLYNISMFLGFIGVWLAYFYVRPFSRNVLHVSERTSFNLILLVNGVGVPGRLVPALIADRLLGPINTFIPVMLFAGVFLFIWISISSVAGVTTFTIFYGFFGAGVQSLLQAALASLNPDPKRAGIRIGMGFSVVGIASLIGSPIGGALIEKAGGAYLYAQVFAGSMMIAGSVVLVAARVSKTGWNLRERM